MGGFIFVPGFSVSDYSYFREPSCVGRTVEDLQIQSLSLNLLAAFLLRAQSHLVDSMCDTHLQFA